MLENLERQFAINTAARFDVGPGGLVRLTLKNASGRAVIYLHGGHVAEYQPTGHDPVLFMSRASHFASDQPIRGGIPLIFPWFGPHATNPDAPPHGRARVVPWHVREVSQDQAGNLAAELTCRFEPHDIPDWPHACDLSYRIELSDALTTTLKVNNTGDQPMRYEAALHTYLSVGDVAKVTIQGLENTHYLDKVAGGVGRLEPNEHLRITGETDRVYQNTTATCRVIDPILGRRIDVEKQNAKSTVVWNPWIAKAARMPDFGDEEWPGMLCIETANVGDNAVTLVPGAVGEMASRLRVAKLD